MAGKAAKSAAQAPELAPPSAVYRLEGHEAAERTIAAAIEDGRLHHAWMLAGPRGIGKATLAYRFARRVLGAAPDPSFGVLGASPEDAVCRQIEAGSHADLAVVSRAWDDKRGVRRSEITVDDIRKLAGFFGSTSAGGGWRVAIIDAADEMNVNAANAILKTLEEPPARALLILVTHAPGRLPATIRSRCRLLRLTPPDFEAAVRVVRESLGVDDEEARMAVELAEGRPGEAAAIAAAEGGELEREVRGLTTVQERFDRARAYLLSQKLSLKDAETARALTFRFLRHIAREGAEHSGRRGVEAWTGLWDELDMMERQLSQVHLEPRLVMLEVLERAHAAARRAEA